MLTKSQDNSETDNFGCVALMKLDLPFNVQSKYAIKSLKKYTYVSYATFFFELQTYSLGLRWNEISNLHGMYKKLPTLPGTNKKSSQRK